MVARPRIEVFEQRAADYDAWFRGPAGRVLFPIEADTVRLVLQGAPRPWLEVGVGTGAFAAELGVELGLDPAGEPMLYARRRGVTCIQGVAEALPFRDGSIGALLLVVTVCFLEDPTVALREAARALAPGGRVIIGEVTADSAWGRAYRKLGEAGHPFYAPARFFTMRQTEELLAAVGLRATRYASTLVQPYARLPQPEPARAGVAEGASFVAIAAARA